MDAVAEGLRRLAAQSRNSAPRIRPRLKTQNPSPQTPMRTDKARIPRLTDCMASGTGLGVSREVRAFSPLNPWMQK